MYAKSAALGRARVLAEDAYRAGVAAAAEVGDARAAAEVAAAAAAAVAAEAEAEAKEAINVWCAMKVARAAREEAEAARQRAAEVAAEEARERYRQLLHRLQAE